MVLLGLGLVVALAVVGTVLYIVCKYNKRRDAMKESSSSSSSQITRPSKFRNEVHQLNESLFELYVPSGKPSLQVVFFHGFQFGDYEDAHLTTWKSGDESCIWPQTWLMEEFPNAHILSVAYASCLTESKEHGSRDLFLIGESLLADLLEAKIGQHRGCPVVLVGHSFGGLVIKELCLHARKTDRPEHNNFLQNVAGLFFYSTPHGGIRLENVAPLFKSKSRLLKNVKLLSKSTSRLNDGFEKLRSVYKDWQVAGVGEGCSTEWPGQSLPFTVVEEASSRYSKDFIVVAYANHVTITRPKRKTSTSFIALARLIHKVCNNPKVLGAIHLTQGLPDFSSGLEKRVKDVKTRLERSKVLGIVGMGGIGKTTIAKQLFNETSIEYEYTCFVHNVKGIPIHDLDGYLLSSFHHYGTQVKRNEIQWSHLMEKKTLIIMDDVDSENQLKKLPKFHNFGGDSLLIITSRAQNVCNIYPDCSIYDVEFLNDDDAKKLLCQNAFGLDNIPKYLLEKDHRLEDCVDGLLQKCQGLPLTLEVMGRYLRPHNNKVGFWKQTVRRLGDAQSINGEEDDSVWASLRVSYDDLAEQEKHMFIEAGTCFFEQPLEEALAAWSASNGCVDVTWENLIKRSLVKELQVHNWFTTTSTTTTTIWVHEHLRDLAKKVSKRHEVSTYDVDTFKGSNSRDAILVKADAKKRVTFWFEAVVTQTEDRRDLDMMRIEPLLNFNESSPTLQLESLEHVGNLEYLYLDDLLPDGSSKNFPINVSLLKWTLSSISGYPDLPGISWKEMSRLGFLELGGWNIPTAFLEELGNLTNLRVLDLYDLKGLDLLPEEIGNLSCLKQLYIGSLSLSTLPDSFGYLEALEHLTIQNNGGILKLPESFGRLHSLLAFEIYICAKLESLPESFGNLKRLKKLIIYDCQSLESLPASFGKLSSLEDLSLEACSRLRKLPDSFVQLNSLKRLTIHASNLEALSDSFGDLSSLIYLELKDCPSLEELPASFGKLSSLEELAVKMCLRLRKLPDNFVQLNSLKRLTIHASNLEGLPDSFGDLSSLIFLELEDCPSLEELPAGFGKLSSLEELYLKGCLRLRKLPDNFGQLNSLKRLTINDASNLEALSHTFGNLSSLIDLELEDCPSLEELPASFGNLSCLEGLHLHQCNALQRLPDNFGQLVALKNLTIKRAQDLQELCDNFGSLRALKYLKLSDCPKLKNLPLSFGILHGLEKLKLSACSHLQRLPDTFVQLTALKKLIIRETDHLEEPCHNFGLLSGLEELELDRYSHLKKSVNTSGQLMALKKLALTIQEGDDLAELCDNVGLRSTVETLVLELKCWKLNTLPDNFGLLTALTKLVIRYADHQEQLPDSIGCVSSLREIELHRCKGLKSLPDSLGEPSSPQLALPRGDRASRSPIKSDGRKASMPKALNCVLHHTVYCDGCRMSPLEGTRFKSTKKPNYDLCSNCFGKAEDQADYVHINEPPDPNGLRLYSNECPFLDEFVLLSLGWLRSYDDDFPGSYLKIAR